MENENKQFGILFDNINLISEEHLEIILSTMDKEHAIFYLVESVKAAYKRGAFTIGESEVISKTLRILSK